MKQRLFTVAAMLVAAVVLSATQGFPVITDRITANVPFSFMVGNTMLPAGEYEFSTPSVNLDYTLMIRQMNGDRSIIVQAMPVSLGYRTVPKTELVFDRVGDQEFLRQVWEAGLQTGDQFLEPKAEREMLAQAGESPLSHRVDAFPVRSQ
jgi:hypothetical protein